MFVGRVDELALFDQLVTRRAGRRVLVALSGVGGVGKTALAVHWAHRVIAGFPDGQLYVNLGAFDAGGPLAPSEVLGRFLRALGVSSGRVPVDVAEQAALFRSLTAERSLLMVLDNAASAAQVRVLLPASERCVVVVTSRWRLASLAADGAHLLTVHPLAEVAGTDLLRHLAGEDRVTSEQSSAVSLVQLCGGLPLALSVTGARLASHPHWPVSRMLRDLAPVHRRLSGLSKQEDLAVRPAFEVSYRALSPVAARCFRLLGLHSAPEFGAGVAAAGLAVGEDEVLDLLDTLVEASLLAEIGDGRYRYHDLVRLHAGERAECDESEHGRDVAQRRMLEWYLAGAREAEQVLTPYRRSREPYHYLSGTPDVDVPRNHEGALDWLERERPALVAAVRHAAERDLHDLAWHLADAMWPLFNLRRHHADRLVVDRIAVDCAQRSGNLDQESKLVKRFALAHVDMGEFAEAAALFTRGLALCERIDDRHGAAGNLEGLGYVALAQHEYSAAADYFTRALSAFEGMGKKRHVALMLFNLGTTQLACGDPRSATDWLERALATFDEFRETDPYNRSRTLCQLGLALGRAGQFDRAGSLLDESLAEMTRLGSPRGQADVWRAQGELALDAGEPSRARTLLAQALAAYTELGDAEAANVAQMLERTSN